MKDGTFQFLVNAVKYDTQAFHGKTHTHMQVNSSPEFLRQVPNFNNSGGEGNKLFR